MADKTTGSFNHKEPLIRIAKRPARTKLQLVLLRVFALVFALIAGGIFIAIMGKNPFEAYKTIIEGAFVGSKRNPFSAIEATVIRFVPLLIVSIGLSFAFRMKFWNIGGEGQIIMGAIFASYFALKHYQMPRPLLLLVMFIAGALGGALWALIPTLFKVKFGTNETLFTLMMNYVALYIIVYLQSGPWQGTKGFASVGLFDQKAYLPKVGGVHIGWIVALILIVVSYIYLKHTKSGYEISVVGESQATAKYAGMNVTKIIIRTMVISGAICGIAGMIQATGNDHTLSTGVTGGVGFTGVTVAWLAQLNPIIISIVSAAFSILKKGSGVMQSKLNLDASAADVLQGIILFFFLGCEFFIRYSFIFRKKSHAKKGAAENK
ncbi:MAG: ABC transporter permease [Clostridiales bacterium]|nr:ABC transporter permease [Clostridiales bacterium]